MLSVVELLVVMNVNFFARFILKIWFFNLDRDQLLVIIIFSNHLFVKPITSGLAVVFGWV